MLKERTNEGVCFGCKCGRRWQEVVIKHHVHDGDATKAYSFFFWLMGTWAYSWFDSVMIISFEYKVCLGKDWLSSHKIRYILCSFHFSMESEWIFSKTIWSNDIWSYFVGLRSEDQISLLTLQKINNQLWTIEHIVFLKKMLMSLIPNFNPHTPCQFLLGVMFVWPIIYFPHIRLDTLDNDFKFYVKSK